MILIAQSWIKCQFRFNISSKTEINPVLSAIFPIRLTHRRFVRVYGTGVNCLIGADAVLCKLICWLDRQATVA